MPKKVLPLPDGRTPKADVASGDHLSFAIDALLSPCAKCEEYGAPSDVPCGHKIGAFEEWALAPASESTRNTRSLVRNMSKAGWLPLRWWKDALDLALATGDQAVPLATKYLNQQGGNRQAKRVQALKRKRLIVEALGHLGISPTQIGMSRGLKAAGVAGRVERWLASNRRQQFEDLFPDAGKDADGRALSRVNRERILRLIGKKK